MRVEITKQPVNHRAQYIGEGSRGPVRSTKGKALPFVLLEIKEETRRALKKATRNCEFREWSEISSYESISALRMIQCDIIPSTESAKCLTNWIMEIREFKRKELLIMLSLSVKEIGFIILAIFLEQSHVCTSKNELIDINSVGILKLKNSTVEAAFGATFFTPRFFEFHQL